ncbi:virulence RhuM family protein [Paenarthrobacter sp. PH39-S1]|uniref:virulence RhuM family protein n=1 Tax=Paenarthrobacter sp. PH39-S1 TaxID=3046204 RepID=UPI0024B8BB29|nr:virulence RhuM family protein [Paenarthrobacter sp. PH39-S1]MDJ0358039.1 virulence RhuM family protein [Paenarthrobacter sp. PH39-S1]
MTDPFSPESSGAAGELVLYTSDDGLAHVQLRAASGTAWLPQRGIADLFGKDVRTINEHIQNVITEGEVDPAATIRKFRIVQNEGNREVAREVEHYNLDVILAVGYRVRSPRGVQFRRWATTVLSEYLVKGFAMDDAKLKDAKQWDYFDEWLERIRDIRASEKRFYQKVLDLYATAVDYDKASNEAQLFFKVVQNKMLWAVTGKTAAELVKDRSDSNAPNMGLTSWAGGRVRKGDISTGKNYLTKEEMADLNGIVTMYLDFAENQAKRRLVVTMADWKEKLDAFLQFNGHELLTNAGSVRAEVAKKLAEDRYGEFDAKRKAVEAVTADASDFAELERLSRDDTK